MVMEPFQVDVLRSETDEDTLRTLQPTGVSSLQNWVEPVSLHLVDQQVEGTAQCLSCVVLSTLALWLILVFTPATTAHHEPVELTLSTIPFVQILYMVNECLQALRELCCSSTA